MAKKEKKENKLANFLDACEEFIAFFAIIIFALIIVNANFDFLPAAVLKVFLIIKEYAGLLLIAITGLECALKRNVFILIVFLLFLAVVVIFMFFGDTYNFLLGMIPAGK